MLAEVAMGGSLWVVGVVALAVMMLLSQLCATALVAVLAHILLRYMRQASFPLELRLRQDIENADDYGIRASSDATAANRTDGQPDKGKATDGASDMTRKRPEMRLTSDLVRGGGFVDPD